MRGPGARDRGDHRLRHRRLPLARASATTHSRSRNFAVTGWQEGRLHSAVLVSPGRERRKDRKLRKAAARARVSEDREARRAEAKRKSEALASEKRSAVLLPRCGEPGPAALRTPGRFRVPRHQDTSATLAGAYPFLAEGGLGSEGVFVGQDLYSGSSVSYTHLRAHEPASYPVCRLR